MSSGNTFDIVVPTVGRPSLDRLLASLARCAGPRPVQLLIVDDHRTVEAPLAAPRIEGWKVGVLRGQGRGPAAARNTGWRASSSTFVAFLDDDVVVPPDWLQKLADDLHDLPDGVAGVQGGIEVPLPAQRRPIDWERNVAGLESARWATADMAYRRSVLTEVGGFDERFRRAYREDADLGLRVTRAGYRIVKGRRRIVHPPGVADFWVSVRLQAGNADDQLMRSIHGPGWREDSHAPPGRLPGHVAVTAASLVCLAAAASGRRALARAAGVAWLAGFLELASARIRPGPRTRGEVFKMAVTSAAMPPVATWYALAGRIRHRKAGPLPRGVLLDRDGTLVVDVPYNSDPAEVRPLDGVRESLDRLRQAGIATAVISNQSGVARGILSMEQVERVNRRIEEVLGPLGPWVICPHGPSDGCGCRKPAPGLVEEAARRLGLAPSECVVIGDIGADVEAALAAGAQAILVPRPQTLPEEIAAAPVVAPDFTSAIDLVLRRRRR